MLKCIKFSSIKNVNTCTIVIDYHAMHNSNWLPCFEVREKSKNRHTSN